MATPSSSIQRWLPSRIGLDRAGDSPPGSGAQIGRGGHGVVSWGLAPGPPPFTARASGCSLPDCALPRRAQRLRLRSGRARPDRSARVLPAVSVPVVLVEGDDPHRLVPPPAPARDQDAVMPPAGADHDRRRRGVTERRRAGDHQHRHRATGASQSPPIRPQLQQRQQRQHDHHRTEGRVLTDRPGAGSAPSSPPTRPAARARQRGPAPVASVRGTTSGLAVDRAAGDALAGLAPPAQLSPVSSDSSRWLAPSTISPSTGTRSGTRPDHHPVADAHRARSPLLEPSGAITRGLGASALQRADRLDRCRCSARFQPLPSITSVMTTARSRSRDGGRGLVISSHIDSIGRAGAQPRPTGPVFAAASAAACQLPAR